MVTLIIDEAEVTVPDGTTVLEAAQKAGIYIPHLCSHPDLPPIEALKPAKIVYQGQVRFENKKPDLKYEGCQLCVVEVEGNDGLLRACNTPVAEGMIVSPNTPDVLDFRRRQLMLILAGHPHACLTCAQREGCARFPCSTGVPENERCCPLFGNCEFQRIADYIGIKKETPRYIFKDLPVVKDEPLIERNYNLCIGCTRCVRVCREVRGVEALDFIFDEEGRPVVGTVSPTLKESGCRFCAACVEVCPTGALLGRSLRSNLRLNISKPILPPKQKRWVEFTLEKVSQVPEVEGVYQLLDEQENVLYIKGAMNLRRELGEQRELKEKARYFLYEEEPMYTRRESQLLQQYIAEHGQMPEGNREFDDLF